MRTRILFTARRGFLFSLFSMFMGMAVESPVQANDFAAQTTAFVGRYCVECHAGDAPAGALNLASLPHDLNDAEHFRRWVKLHDHVASGQMPPADSEQPTAEERAALLSGLSRELVAAEHAAADETPRLRRLTRAEYEHTIRDLFDMPGIALAGNLPADGSAHGFDKHAEALDVSHVNIAKYLESADHVLDYAIATRPNPPTIQQRRISLVNRGGFVAHVVMNGDGVLLKDKRPDPEFPPAAEQNHLDQGAHERWGSFRNGATVGLFRHEDESFNPYFIEHVTIYPGRYRLRTSLWSFQWDKGQVLPGRGTEAGRLSVVQLTGDGRGGQHPSYVLGYFDAPNTEPIEHELHVWLNHNEIIGFNTASLAPTANYARPGRAMAFTGPGIAVDWLDIEGPLHEVWPPRGHRLLFGDLPMTEFVASERSGVRAPRRMRVRQLGAGMNRPDPEPGVWTVRSESELEDAERLLSDFLPKLFRRPVDESVKRRYQEIVAERLAAGDCFESAMRAAYRAALCAPDFLYHIESSERLDDFALACRLSYFLWNSLPDEQLMARAAAGDLRRPETLHGEVERLFADPRSHRFVEDFLGQWLKLRQIAATDPDRKLYPEFSPYLQDSMLAESRAYFRKMLDGDLDASYLVKSPFVMVNQKLATHYGIDGVSGAAMRPVTLPADCPRGGILTQAAILKITANGTTTSPVPRGAFVMERLLGEPPDLPPSNVAAIEPDVRGATTIREQLAKHREDAICATCHRRIDPPGFALEAFDVIGGFRDRYRSIGEGDAAPRDSIDPFIPIGFKLGPAVDASGELPDGREFTDVREYQTLVAEDATKLLRNLARQWAVYSTGRAVRFADRPRIEQVVQRTLSQGGGVRTLLHELVGSPLFTGDDNPIQMPDEVLASTRNVEDDAEATSHRMIMTAVLPAVDSPVQAEVASVAPSETAVEHSFDEAHRVRVRVIGLFEPHRVDDLKSALAEFPEVLLVEIDDATAEATLAYAATSELFRNANPEQIVDRMNNRVRQLSGHTLGIQPPIAMPRDQLERIEWTIRGLDCQACSLAVYDILQRIPGVEHATASFHTGRATALIDPTKTDRTTIEAALKARGVTFD